MYSVVRAAAQRAPLHSSCVSSCVRSLPRRSPSSPQIAQPQNVHGGTSPFATLAGSPAAGSPGDRPQSTSYPRRQQRSPRRDNDSLEAIRACGSDWRKAVELLDALKGEGKATLRTYNASIQVCARNREPAKALELLLDMEEYNIYPDVVSLSSVVNACAKARMWRPALEVLDSMAHFGVRPNVVTLNAAISACEKCGR